MTKTDLLRSKIFYDVNNERVRQERLKQEGRFTYSCADEEMSDDLFCAVLGEEFGEVCRAAMERNNMALDVTGANLRMELIQVMAVCLARLELLDSLDS